MHYSFTEEQDQFREVIQRFTKRCSPSSEVRRLMDSADGYDPGVWQQLSRGLGLTGLQVPETYGGSGFGFIELSIAAEEMGRALLCAPFFASTVLATNAIINGATQAAKEELLPVIATGECIAALAVSEASGDWDVGGIALTAIQDEEDYVLNGTKKFVIDGHTAEVLIVAARAPGTSGDEGISLFKVLRDAAGLERRLLETIDTTRKQAELVFDGVRGKLISEVGAGAGAITRTFDQAAVVLANEMVGGAQALLEAALEYSKLRMQFGRTIGSFQAIKHKCADLLLHVEMAKAAAYYAAAAIDENDPDVPALASLAKATAADTYMHTAAQCIQIHGGVGFTWDHDTHLWFKRAKSSEVLLGDPTYHRERYMRWVAA